MTALQATHLYHIAQEACTNALRHARATAVAVALRVSAPTATLSVRDDGVGIGTAREGLGLRIMRHRARLIGGRLAVAPARPGGTAVTCDLQLEGADGRPQA